ncbi:hypothetical protein M758_6G164500 [Ceratodon purpureus]|nr:hypothetical protein M758_6G164500 [Ceratodon purpureus]
MVRGRIHATMVKIQRSSFEEHSDSLIYRGNNIPDYWNTSEQKDDTHTKEMATTTR